jgi:hypothetical protein
LTTIETLIDALTFGWKQPLMDLWRIVFAFVLERHEMRRNMGLGIFPNVAMAACGFMLIAKNVPGANAEIRARGYLSRMGNFTHPD